MLERKEGGEGESNVINEREVENSDETEPNVYFFAGAPTNYNQHTVHSQPTTSV